MALKNPEKQIELLSLQKQQLKKGDKQLMDEIQNLKKVVLNLEMRQINRVQKKNSRAMQNLPEQKNETEELQPKIIKSGETSRLAFGNDFCQEIKQNFRTRFMSKKDKRSPDRKESSPPFSEEKDESEEKSIIHQSSDLSQGEILKFMNQRPDSDEEQPPKNQIFAPPQRTNSAEPTEFHFRKVDYIPNIEQENSKFYLYMKSYRDKRASSRTKVIKELPSTANSLHEALKTSSQPERFRQKAKKKQLNLELFLSITLNKGSSHDEILKTGQRILKHFFPLFSPQDSFIIKKYKNCIIFSLLPTITKAAIWYFSEELYVGNISLSEDGKIQKNGVGTEWVKNRHFYEGYFINGKKNGKGKIIYQTGDQYEGQWNEGQIYGFGRFFNNTTKKAFEGFWSNGQFCGEQPLSASSNFNVS